MGTEQQVDRGARADGQDASWSGWGTHRPELSAGARRFLHRELQATLDPVRPATAGPPPASRLAPAALEELRALVGDAHVRVDDQARLSRTGGHSYADLVHRRAGAPAHVPDAVVLPADATQVAQVLRVCAANDVAVVPVGGGTSVVGGVEPLAGDHAAVVALDLRRLDRVGPVDATSLTAVLQPGLSAVAAEAALGARGLTLGHFPQSFERASIGGFVVTRSAGQASSGYGRFDDLVLGARLATPTGELVLPALPSSAAGPDLRRLVLGSEGSFGVLTEVTVRVHPAPAHRRYEGWLLRSWPQALEVARLIAQRDGRPDVVRLSDEAETRAGFALTGPSGAARRLLHAYVAARRRRTGCLVILGFDGDRDSVRWRRRRAARLLRAHGAVALGRRAGEAWRHGRFAGPYLRDTLLDHGLLVETMETAATWDRLPELHESVRSALAGSLAADGARALVGCHVSHVYATGASLYYTVLARAEGDGAESRVAQWWTAKRAAMDAVVAAGGTVTHHHGVGTDHRPWLSAELGDVGVRVLAAVKRELDPTGVLNPGKLLPG